MVVVTSQGQAIDSVDALTAKEVFTNNNLFRAATFRPKKTVRFEDVLKAADAYKRTFGEQIKEVEQGVVATAIRAKVQPITRRTSCRPHPSGQASACPAPTCSPACDQPDGPTDPRQRKRPILSFSRLPRRY